ncbi:hypothetical protein [Colwellia sp. MEBiC06753]
MEPQPEEIETTDKQSTFWCLSKDWFDIDKPPKKVLGFLYLALFLLVFVLVLISYSVFDKLDGNTKYLVTANSEHISYQSEELMPPPILLKNFKYALNCDNYGDTTYSEGEIGIGREFDYKFTRIQDSELVITILKSNKRTKELKDNNIETNAYLDVDGELIEFDNCVAISIALTEENPVFAFNAMGNIELGKNITDATEAYTPLLLSGEITVTDESLFTNSPYQFTPYSVRRSDYVFAKFSKRNTPTAVIRAIKEEPGLTGVLSLHGGELYVQRYRMEPQLINSSFIDRISNDFELAFSLSAALIFIQFLFGIINFLLRVEMINTN